MPFGMGASGFCRNLSDLLVRQPLVEINVRIAPVGDQYNSVEALEIQESNCCSPFVDGLDTCEVEMTAVDKP